MCLVAQLCPALRGPIGCSSQAPLSMGFSRPEYWSGLPFPTPGDSSAPRDPTHISWVSCLIPSSCECEYIWKWVNCNQIKMRSLGWALVWLVSLEKRKTQGTMPCDHKGRDWNTVSTSRETQGLPATPQGRRGVEQFVLWRREPCQHLDFRLLVSRTVRECELVVLSHLVCASSLWQT